jgi:hypothetical protein
MFELETKDNGVVGIVLKKNEVLINVAQSTVSADLKVGEIKGAGEFEIGEAAINAIEVSSGKVIYRVNISGIVIGVIGGIEDGLDDLGPVDILATSSAKAVVSVEPKMVIAMENAEEIAKAMNVDMKFEKKVKIKNEASLPASLEVFRLG